MMIATTVEINVNVNLEPVFQFVAEDDVLPRILVGSPFLPRVMRTANATGPWSKPGSKRMVHLAGGNTAQEELLYFKLNEYFEYKVSDFTFVLKYFAKHAIGQWWFEQKEERTTYIKWTYSFAPHNTLCRPIVWIFSKLLWKGYMKNAMIATKAQLEEMKQYNTLPLTK